VGRGRGSLRLQRFSVLNLAQSYPGLRDGVTWRATWHRQAEGGYTLAGKLLIANRIDPGELFGIAITGKSLFPGATNWRSFNTTAWLPEGGAVLQWFRDKLHHAALETTVGKAVLRLCAAERLRYCPECFSFGYQSSVCQIEALDKCPIHGCELRNRCQVCGGSTPSYALTPRFNEPFSCEFCGSCFGRGDASRLSSWNAPIDTAPYARLLADLQPLARLRLGIKEVDSWQPRPNADSAYRGKAGFFLLAKASGAKLDPDLFSVPRSTCFTVTRAVVTGSPICRLLHDRTAIYKSIRRRLRKGLRIPDSPSNRSGLGLAMDYRTQAVRMVEGTFSADVLAYFVWRNRFERELLLNCSAVKEGLRLRDAAVAWPMQTLVTNHAWGHFVWQAFKADHESAVRWLTEDARLATAGDEDSRALRRELYRIMVPHVSPLLSLAPPSLLAVRVRDEQEPEESYLFGRSE